MEAVNPTKPTLKVVTLHKSHYRDPAATLRVIADEIEAGKYGEVRRVGVVLKGDGPPAVFGMGPDAAPASIGMLLYSGLRHMEEVADLDPLAG